jgi:hypothetical protein
MLKMIASCSELGSSRLGERREAGTSWRSCVLRVALISLLEIVSKILGRKQ